MAKKNQKTILVTGATGHQGGAVFEHLRKSNKFALRVLTRDPEKPAARGLVGSGVDVIKGDLDDSASLKRALEEVDGVYSVQDFRGGSEAEVRQGVNLIDAANQEGVSHLVYSSVGSADQKTGIPHFESKAKVEEHLRNSGVPHTIFRPVFFMENWLGYKDQIKSGSLSLPLRPETHLAMISVEDIGAFVTAAFEKPGRWIGRTLDIAGDDLAMADIAKALGAEYKQMPWDQFEKAAGHEMAVMFHWFEDVGYHIDIETLKQELPSLTNFERWINTKWQSSLAEASREASA